MFVDWASNSNAFKAEIYFVGAREFPSCRFGGRLDEVQDPQTGLIVTLRAFGEYALRVIDPTKLILNLVGTVDVTNNEAITDWVAQQLLKVTRTAVTTQLMSGAWPILGLSVHSPEIEAAALPAANEQLADYGLAITRFGNLDVNLDDDDNARLKKLAGDTAYSRLAGGFLQAAQAEALQGAGEGMAQGGAAVTPLFLGAGFGMANQMMQPPPQAAPPPPPGARLRRRRPGLHASSPQPLAAASTDRRPRPGRAACDRGVRQLPQPGPRRREVLRQLRHAHAEALHQLQRRPEPRREVLRGVRHPGQPAARLSAPAPAHFSSGARPRPVPALPSTSRTGRSPWRRAAVSHERLPEWTGSNASGARPRTRRAARTDDLRRAAGQEGPRHRLRLGRGAPAAGHDGVPLLQLHLPDRGRDRPGRRAGPGPG